MSAETLDTDVVKKAAAEGAKQGTQEAFAEQEKKEDLKKIGEKQDALGEQLRQTQQTQQMQQMTGGLFGYLNNTSLGKWGTQSEAVSPWTLVVLLVGALGGALLQHYFNFIPWLVSLFE